MLGDKFTIDELMWSIPLAQLNQLIHAHLCYNGATCRRRGTIEAIDTRFDALCDAYGKGVLTTRPVLMA